MKRIFGFLLAMLAVITFAVPTAYAADTSLLSKQGVLSITPATTAEEVVGFNYVKRVSGEDYCISYYSANPPVIGTTQPREISCPLGIRNIEDYNIKYEEAVAIFNAFNFGGAFESISLSWPVTPKVQEPIWRFRSSFGSEIIIGANTGDLHFR